MSHEQAGVVVAQPVDALDVLLASRCAADLALPVLTVEELEVLFERGHTAQLGEVDTADQRVVLVALEFGLEGLVDEVHAGLHVGEAGEAHHALQETLDEVGRFGEAVCLSGPGPQSLGEGDFLLVVDGLDLIVLVAGVVLYRVCHAELPSS